MKEECRDVGATRFIETLMQDLRYGLRQLRRNPGFTAVAVITLALGIGANTAIFSVVDGALFARLPYRRANRLVILRESFPRQGYSGILVSAPDVVAYQRQNTIFKNIAAFDDVEFDLSGRGQPERITAARVSPSLFPLLGAKPLLGRTFAEQENRPGILVAVLSYGLWKRQFAANPRVIGQTVTLNMQPYTIVGVMPRRFQFPLPGLLGEPSADLWVPIAFTPAELGDVGNNYIYGVIGRLKAGATLAQANADANVIAQHIWKQALSGLPAAQLGALVTPLRETWVGNVHTLLVVLLGAVGLVMLIACVNVANLLLARASRRHKEIAVRAAMGAGRFRLFRQLVSETSLLALLGGVVALPLAVWGAELLVRLAPGEVVRSQTVSLNIPILVFTFALAGLTGLVFGTVPALFASNINLDEALKEGSRGMTANRPHERLRAVLVVSEIALALMLLSGAGLLMKSFLRLRHTNPGFNPEHVITASIDLPEAGYDTPSDVKTFYSQLLTKLRHMPGVRAAGIGSELPMSLTTDRTMTLEGYPILPNGKWPRSTTTWVMGDYFRALGTPLLRGRLFTEGDRLGSRPVVIISKDIARRYWFGQDPIGKRLHFGIPDTHGNPWLTVIGVVGEVKHGPLDAASIPATYVPFSQAADSRVVSMLRSEGIAVRTWKNPGSIASTLRRQVGSLDRELAVADVQTMTEILDKSVAPHRFDLFLLGTFALLALLLAAVGIHGVISYSVSQRTHEMGVRMALGAQRGDVLRLVVAQGLKLTALGAGLGIAGALALTRFLSSLLYGVKPNDPLTFVAVSIVLSGIALIACYIPARRAAQVDPMTALRYE